MVWRFGKSGYSGFYLAVTKEGEVEAGDAITQLEHEPHSIKVTDISHLYLQDTQDLVTMQRALQIPALPQGWQDFSKIYLLNTRKRRPKQA